MTLNETNHWQLYVPEGFAHGFCVTSDTADVIYKCTSGYAPQFEQTILWNDPDLKIPWPVTNPLLSAKDQRGQRLRDLNLGSETRQAAAAIHPSAASHAAETG